MIKEIKTTKEEVVLSEERNGVNYEIKLLIDYDQIEWTILDSRYRDFVFSRTRNLDAGIAISNLIKEATFIAYKRLDLNPQKWFDLNLPF